MHMCAVAEPGCFHRGGQGGASGSVCYPCWGGVNIIFHKILNPAANLFVGIFSVWCELAFMCNLDLTAVSSLCF